MKSRFPQSLVLKYLFIYFLFSFEMLCELLYTSCYYLNVNCIDLNVLTLIMKISAGWCLALMEESMRTREEPPQQAQSRQSEKGIILTA